MSLAVASSKWTWVLSVYPSSPQYQLTWTTPVLAGLLALIALGAAAWLFRVPPRIVGAAEESRPARRQPHQIDRVYSVLCCAMGGITALFSFSHVALNPFAFCFFIVPPLLFTHFLIPSLGVCRSRLWISFQSSSSTFTTTFSQCPVTRCYPEPSLAAIKHESYSSPHSGPSPLCILSLWCYSQDSHSRGTPDVTGHPKISGTRHRIADVVNRSNLTSQPIGNYRSSS